MLYSFIFEAVFFKKGKKYVFRFVIFETVYDDNFGLFVS